MPALPLALSISACRYGSTDWHRHRGNDAFGPARGHCDNGNNHCRSDGRRSNESPRCVATTVAAGSRHRGWNRSGYRMSMDRFVSVRKEAGTIYGKLLRKENVLNNTSIRIEKDSLGEVQVPADRLWGPKPSGRLSTSASARISFRGR